MKAKIIYTILLLALLSSRANSEVLKCENPMETIWLSTLSIRICLNKEIDRSTKEQFVVGVTHEIKNISNKKVYLILYKEQMFSSNFGIVKNGKLIFFGYEEPVYLVEDQTPGTNPNMREYIDPYKFVEVAAGSTFQMHFSMVDLKHSVQEVSNGFGSQPFYNVYLRSNFNFLRDDEYKSYKQSSRRASYVDENQAFSYLSLRFQESLTKRKSGKTFYIYDVRLK